MSNVLFSIRMRATHYVCHSPIVDPIVSFDTATASRSFNTAVLICSLDTALPIRLILAFSFDTAFSFTVTGSHQSSAHTPCSRTRLTR